MPAILFGHGNPMNAILDNEYTAALGAHRPGALLYVVGTHQAGEQVSFPVEGMDGGSVSMLTVMVGGE